MTIWQRDKLNSYLRDTCIPIEVAIEFLVINTTSTEAEKRLLECDLEACKGCGFWKHSGELDNEIDGKFGWCDYCVWLKSSLVRRQRQLVRRQRYLRNAWFVQ